MKIALAVLLGFAVIIAGVLGYSYYNYNQFARGEISALKDQISKLNSENSQLVADNAKYMKQANLKSFTTLKELERFVKADTTDQEFKNDYASKACINMMVNAREQGYWIGMGVLNQSQEGLLTAMLKDRERGGMSWTTYCLAVVGDADIYFVDPQNDGYIFSVMTMSADWADYSGREVDFR